MGGILRFELLSFRHRDAKSVKIEMASFFLRNVARGVLSRLRL